MSRHPLPATILGICFLAMGVLVVRTALLTTRNALTKMVYWLCTIAPRAGSMSDEKWVMINGIVMLAVGLLLLTLSAFGVI